MFCSDIEPCQLFGDNGDLFNLLPNLRGDDDAGLYSNNVVPRKSAGKQKKTSITKYRKDSVDTDSLRTREKYQRAQADRLRKAFKDGKQQILLVSSQDNLGASNRSWAVPCVREFYEDAYGVVRGCTPSVARGGECTRSVHDGFGTPQQMAEMVEITERAMQNLFHQVHPALPRD
jgi:hypothetical protein